MCKAEYRSALNGNFTRDFPPRNSTIAHSRHGLIKHTMAKRKVIEDEQMEEADSAESSSEESSSEDVCISSEAVRKLCLTQSLGCRHAGRRVRMV